MPTPKINIAPRDKSFQDAATYLKYWFGCRQASGEVRDSKGGASAIKNAGFLDAEAWVNAGYLTTGADSTKFATLAAGNGQDFTLATHSFVFSVRLKKATSASNEKIINGYDTVGGIGLTAYSTGQLQLALKATDGTTLTINIAAASATTLDGNEHCVTFIVGRDNVSAQWYVDDAKSGTTGNNGVYGKSFIGGNALVLGGSTQAGVAKSAQFATIQAYAVPKDLAAINAAQVHGWIMRHPHLPVPDWMF